MRRAEALLGVVLPICLRQRREASALYRAKSAGGNRVEVADDVVSRDSAERS